MATDVGEDQLSEQLADALEELEAQEAESARRHLKVFVYKTWDYVEPDTELKWNWHLDVLCEELEAIERGEPDHRRSIFNVPPGTMKSLLINVFFRAWVWARNPSKRFLSASYGAHLSVRDNLRLRNIIKSDWYQLHFEVRLEGDQDAKERFNTTKSGWCIATSVGGVGTGEHPDFFIIDDPLSAEQARSDVYVSAVNGWFDRTVSTRGVARDAAIIVVMQRLHENDLSGYLLDKDRTGWRHICIPMRYERCDCPPEAEADPTVRCKYHKINEAWTPSPQDIRHAEGELLWPDLFDEQKTKQLELDLDAYGTAGQLQQRPAPEGGGLFKREWFRFISVAPKIARRVRAWDTAATEETGKKNVGDYTAGVKIAEDDGIFYIEDARHERLSPAGVDVLIRNTAEADGKVVSVRELREPGSSGKTVTAARLKMMVGFDYAERLVTGDKVTESKPLRAQCEGGNVYIIKTGDPATDAWVEPFIQELCSFPTGRFDDQVDGASAAFNAVLLEPRPKKLATWGR